MKQEIKIPEIAENVDTGTVAAVLLSVGDKVEADQAVIELETDKATADIPSPYPGIIKEILVEAGDEVKVGAVFAVVEAEESEAAETEDKHAEEKEIQKPEPEQTESKSSSPVKPSAKSAEDIPAAPSVRRLAREKGIDLSKIEGSGPGGRILKGDLEAGTKKTEDKPQKQESSGVQQTAQPTLPDFDKWGSTTSEAMNNIRKVTAESMQLAWSTIPQVTQFDEADITELEAFRQKHKAAFEKRGQKLTVTVLLLKVVTYALQRFPKFNSSLDLESKEIIYKHFYNVGVAADTERGLLVPVIKNTERKSLTQLAGELGELAEKARNNKLQLDEMQGGNFTISNLGGIGGTGFTPIVYAPQVAIMGVSEAQYKQVYKDGEFQKRLVMPLSLSYDHRVIDGAEGARFLRWICNALSDPYTLFT